MDRQKYSAIAHRAHVIYSPVSEAALDAFLARLDLQPDQHVIDVGCGRAEVLVRLVERFNVFALGIDPAGPFLARARQNAVRRVPFERLELQLTDAAHCDGRPDGYDLVVCMGGPFGMAPADLEALRRFGRPGGRLLVGAGYWKQEPDPAYLEATGIPRAEMTDHAGNLANATAAGLHLRHAAESTLDDWDQYEGLYHAQVCQYVSENPEDPDAPAMAARAERWYDSYRRWGRETLGFALYHLAIPD